MAAQSDARRWERLREIYGAARSIDPAQRGEYLAQACGGDEALRAELESLLAQPSEDSFLQDPAWAPPDSIEDAEPTSAPARRHPFFWLVAAAALLLAWAFGWIVLRMGAPDKDFGWTERRRGGRVEVATVAESGPAAGLLQTGDRLLSLNGDGNAGRTGTLHHRRWLASGERYEAVVDRQGERVRVELAVWGAPPKRAFRIAYFLIGLVWCGIGVFIGLARPQDPVARVAFLAAVLAGFVFLSVGNRPAWNVVAPLHGVLGFHFFYLFPGGAAAGGLWRWLLGLAYSGGLLLAARNTWKLLLAARAGPAAVTEWEAGAASFLQSLLPSRALGYSGEGESYLPAVEQAIGLPVFGLAMIGAIACAIHRYRRVQDADDRRRFHWVAVGGILGLLPPLLWTAMQAARLIPGFAPALEGAEVWRDISLAANASSVAVPAAIAYAVLRYRVFDIAVVIRKGLQYLMARAVLQAMLAVPLAALGYTLFQHRHRTLVELAGAASTEILWIAVLALALRCRKRLLGWLDRRFFREQYSGEVLLEGLIERFRQCDSAEQINQAVSRELEAALHPAHLWVFGIGQGRLRLEHSSSDALRPEHCPLRPELVEALGRESGSPASPMPERARLSPAEASWLRRWGVRALLPLAGPSRVHGVLMLGGKRSEEPYSADDLRLLRAVAGQAALVRDNLSLHEQVASEQRVRREVLARVVPELEGLLRECPQCGACYDSGVERCERDGTELTLTLPVPRILDGRYRLERLIGRGGMGAVYEAVDQRLRRVVAVKVMLGAAFGNAAAQRRFRREARLAASLHHPNIVEVHDYGEIENGGAFVVMEMLGGRTLRAELRQSGRLAPARARQWLDPALAGLAAAHEHGLVHRDFKPENVMGQPDPAGGLAVKVLDFGLAKPLPRDGGDESVSITQTGFVLGPLAYMAPEQMAGAMVGQPADVYSAGVVIYEALAGKRPFEEGRRGGGEPDWKGFPAGGLALREVVRRCLEPAPGQRFANAAELRSALLPALPG